jgi:hypothetical protein
MSTHRYEPTRECRGRIGIVRNLAHGLVAVRQLRSSRCPKANGRSNGVAIGAASALMRLTIKGASGVRLTECKSKSGHLV